MRFFSFISPLSTSTAVKAGVLAAVLLCSACVYRVPIQQGNLLEQKDLDQIKLGMTESQVRYVLGTPLVMDPFSSNRWDYVYYLKKGRMREPEERHFVVHFDNGTVSKIENLTNPKG